MPVPAPRVGRKEDRHDLSRGTLSIIGRQTCPEQGMRSEEARRGPFPWHPRGLQITALTASSGRRALKASQPRKLPEMRKESGGLLPSWRFLPCCINGLAVREKRRPNRQGAPPQPRRPSGANQRRAFLNGGSPGLSTEQVHKPVDHSVQRPSGAGISAALQQIAPSVGSRRLVDRSQGGKQPMHEAGVALHALPMNRTRRRYAFARGEA